MKKDIRVYRAFHVSDLGGFGNNTYYSCSYPKTVICCKICNKFENLTPRNYVNARQLIRIGNMYYVVLHRSCEELFSLNPMGYEASFIQKGKRI